MILAAVEHACAIERHVLGVRRADGRRLRGPVQAVEHIDARVPLGQGRQLGVQSEQTAQFAAIGHAPNALAEMLFAVHGRDEVQRLLPSEGEFRETRTATPDQNGPTVA
ncbi:MAG: hypothetical protein Q8K82_06380 [Gemmatimonadaceae bacterium]|nr:hypothetical protein [Gemmatimonadaceae bacterium]